MTLKLVDEPRKGAPRIPRGFCRGQLGATRASIEDLHKRLRERVASHAFIASMFGVSTNPVKSDPHSAGYVGRYYHEGAFEGMGTRHKILGKTRPKFPSKGTNPIARIG